MNSTESGDKNKPEARDYKLPVGLASTRSLTTPPGFGGSAPFEKEEDKKKAQDPLEVTLR